MLRSLRILVGAAAAVLALALAAGCTADAPARPGIVLITVDGLVLSDTSAGGGPIPAPALERLASGARVWTDAWTAVPLSRPAAATYLTGVGPDRHGVLDDLYDRLPADLPELGGLLTQAGFRSAAFSESSAMAVGSGLVDGFELVDPAPAANNVFRRHTPNIKLDGSIAKAFADWLGTVPQGTRYFAWVHLSMPFRAQEHPNRTGAEASFQGFDESLTRILDALDARDGDASVILAGTFGLVAGDGNAVNGLGTSMAESALQVPVIARAPGVESWRPSDAFVWAPDVAVTVARLGGVEIEGAEGVDLAENPGERLAFAASRVPLDQLGWEPIAAARLGRARLAREGGERAEMIGDPAAEVDPGTRDRLSAELDRRALPTGERLPLEIVQPLLERLDVAVDPAPAGGRAVPAGPQRDATLRALWENRRVNGFARSGRALASLQALVEAAPQSALPPVDLGLYRVLFKDDPSGMQLAGGSAARYPTHPEVVRWFALTALDADLGAAEQLLQTVLVVRPADSFLLYDLACTRARHGDYEGAVDRLRSAAAVGFQNWDLLAQDPDLRPLRENGDLARLMKELGR